MATPPPQVEVPPANQPESVTPEQSLPKRLNPLQRCLLLATSVVAGVHALSVASEVNTGGSLRTAAAGIPVNTALDIGTATVVGALSAETFREVELAIDDHRGRHTELAAELNLTPSQATQLHNEWRGLTNRVRHELHSAHNEILAWRKSPDTPDHGFQISYPGHTLQKLLTGSYRELRSVGRVQHLEKEAECLDAAITNPKTIPAEVSKIYEKHDIPTEANGTRLSVRLQWGQAGTEFQQVFANQREQIRIALSGDLALAASLPDDAEAQNIVDFSGNEISVMVPELLFLKTRAYKLHAEILNDPAVALIESYRDYLEQISDDTPNLYGQAQEMLAALKELEQLSINSYDFKREGAITEEMIAARIVSWVDGVVEGLGEDVANVVTADDGTKSLEVVNNAKLPIGMTAEALRDLYTKREQMLAAIINFNIVITTGHEVAPDKLETSLLLRYGTTAFAAVLTATVSSILKDNFAVLLGFDVLAVGGSVAMRLGARRLMRHKLASDEKAEDTTVAEVKQSGRELQQSLPNTTNGWREYLTNLGVKLDPGNEQEIQFLQRLFADYFRVSATSLELSQVIDYQLLLPGRQELSDEDLNFRVGVLEELVSEPLGFLIRRLSDLTNLQRLEEATRFERHIDAKDNIYTRLMHLESALGTLEANEGHHSAEIQKSYNSIAIRRSISDKLHDNGKVTLEAAMRELDLVISKHDSGAEERAFFNSPEVRLYLSYLPMFRGSKEYTVEVIPGYTMTFPIAADLEAFAWELVTHTDPDELQETILKDLAAAPADQRYKLLEMRLMVHYVAKAQSGHRRGHNYFWEAFSPVPEGIDYSKLGPSTAINGVIHPAEREELNFLRSQLASPDAVHADYLHLLATWAEVVKLVQLKNDLIQRDLRTADLSFTDTKSAQAKIQQKVDAHLKDLLGKSYANYLNAPDQKAYLQEVIAKVPMDTIPRKLMHVFAGLL